MRNASLESEKINYQLVLQAFKSACIVLNTKLLYVKLFKYPGLLSFDFCHVNTDVGCARPGFQK